MSTPKPGSGHFNDGFDGDEPVVLTPLTAPSVGGLKLQHMMFAVLVFAAIFWLAMVARLWLVAVLMVFLIVVAFGLAVLLSGRAASQQESFLWALAIAAERARPLSPAALAFAEQYGRGFRWRVQYFAALLNSGRTLPEAIDQVPGLLSRDAELLIKTGWSSGNLPGALSQAASARSTRHNAWGAVGVNFVYLTWAFLVMQVVIGFVMYFIVPKFEAIFNDFGLELPAVTLWTIRASHALMGFAGIPLFLCMILQVVGLILLPLTLFNVFQWDVPLIDWFFRRRHTALLLRSLALSVDGQKPINGGLSVLAEDYPSSFIRKRLRRAEALAYQGTPWVDALLDTGLVTNSEAAVLESAQRAGNLSWALRETAAASERRFGYRLRVWLQILFPLLVAAMGALVLVMGLAYFLPLVSLISRLAT